MSVLKVSDCGMKRLDSRIFQLRHLTCLHLRGNSLTEVPDGIGALSQLAELSLQHNLLSTFPTNVCRLPAMQRSLRVLDVSDNQIKHLPVQLCELANLVTFKAANNLLEQIPPTIGRLQQLKVLTLSGNKLTVLPAGFLRLRLEDVDLYGNCFVEGNNETTASHVDVPTLLECAARFVKKHR